VNFRVRNPANFFSLPRKKERTEETNQYSEYFGLRVEKIERIEDQPTQCILIDHPDHLYLTDDYIVTHNTLASEAVAEALHRPLYTVSVGELGTTPENMEERLRSILDLAYQWNAVLLLDEADIFMEARDTTNVERNAMVSIFLRQLEYYSGVMFLTTNRVANFDPAFFSRISLGICFPKLDGLNRENVWHNVMVGAGLEVDRFDLKRLSIYEVNGRNIKTAVRIAQTMAAGDKRAVTQDDLVEVLAQTETFNRHLANPAAEHNR
jgi:AAA+ superfamily predicted ATPase